MEASKRDVEAHFSTVGKALADACRLRAYAPLFLSHSDPSEETLVARVHARSALREGDYAIVLSDLSISEEVVALPGLGSTQYWLGLHEAWRRKKRTNVFLQGGLRVYIGTPPDAVQIIRLEWFAPQRTSEGATLFDGAHAGHPHWHVDRAALSSQSDYTRSLEQLTAPTPIAGGEVVEVFDPAALRDEAPSRPVYDCSWLPSLHLVAHAGWMLHEWDGHEQPGPHQSEPTTAKALTNWWLGALRYVALEIQTHGS